ncbi:ABC transporter permease [Endozoicomonas sp. G2_1]|uniref:ABC transporter permease n=1 Tax=Endozoicomonas sp. G2_1 TaxID=2821091 RepID=UPI001AD9C75F|nr:ABC transporter permease [Endozoicomonas sp. G2_1]MBO9490585.1 ABC transporter permease [Endozoicomonas sp. G2_1]
MFFKIACQSLRARKGSVLISVFAITVSMMVIIGVEHISKQAKNSFASSVSGIDLIVGARTSQLNLLLYSVFRIGSPTNNMSWQSYQNIEQNKAVAWTIPLSLGDSHQGYRVLGTNQNYFVHFRYRDNQALAFAEGREFQGTYEIVLGASVAKKLNYQLQQSIIIAHGIGKTSFHQHDRFPFRVVGILEPTGTPIDETIHTSLKGIEAIHSSASKSANSLFNGGNFEPSAITAVLVGLKSRMQVFGMQRQINTNRSEPLLAILPGVALAELWQALAILEKSLRLISIVVVVSATLGLSAMLLSSIDQRKEEIKLLRMVGASPFFICSLIELEAVLITLISALLAIFGVYFSLFGAQQYILSAYGVIIDNNIFTYELVAIFIGILLLTIFAALPATINTFRKVKFT